MQVKCVTRKSLATLVGDLTQGCTGTLLFSVKCRNITILLLALFVNMQLIGCLGAVHRKISIQYTEYLFFISPYTPCGRHGTSPRTIARL